MTKCYWDYVYEVKKVYDSEGRKWYEVIKKINFPLNKKDNHKN